MSCGPAPCLVPILPLVVPAWPPSAPQAQKRSEEHTSELQSQSNLVCRLLLEKKNAIHDSYSPQSLHTNASGDTPTSKAYDDLTYVDFVHVSYSEGDDENMIEWRKEDNPSKTQ